MAADRLTWPQVVWTLQVPEPGQFHDEPPKSDGFPGLDACLLELAAVEHWGAVLSLIRCSVLASECSVVRETQ